MKHSFLRQIVFPVLAALIWGTAFVAQRRCAAVIPPFLFNALRSAVAAAVLVPVACAFDAAERRTNAAPKPTDRRALLLGGALLGLTLAAGANLQQIGVAGAAVGKAGFITSSYVVLVPVVGLLLRKRVGLPVWISVLLAAAGLWFLCLKRGESPFTDLRSADLALVGCAVCYAFQIHIVDHFVQKAGGVWLAAGQFAVCAVLSALVSALFETARVTDALACLWPLLYVGVVSSGLAYTLQMLAQKDSNPAVVSLLFSLESVFAVLAGALLLGDRLSGREYLGCALMLAAVVLAQAPLPHRNP